MTPPPQNLPGRRFAFATVTAQATITTGESFSSSGGAITATRIFNNTKVVCAGLTGIEPSPETIQVVARSELGEFCKLVTWRTVAGSDLEAEVVCYDNQGAIVQREFRILVMQ
ncbi:MAG: hypothetical protein ACRENP_08560 [Longimicrobiales bacterium]